MIAAKAKNPRSKLWGRGDFCSQKWGKLHFSGMKKAVHDNFMVGVLIAFIIFNIFLVVYSLRIGNLYAVKGQLGFVGLALLLYVLRIKLRMSELTYAFLLSGFTLHVSQVLGNFYYHSPIIIPWDYLTHIIPFIGFSLLLFNLQKERMDHQNIVCFRNVSLFMTLFLTISGIGVLIEVGEYAGYALLGVKDGALLFGGGDFDTIVVTSDVATEIDKRGGGWYDSMSDLLVNSYATLLTLLILFANHFYGYRKYRKKK